MPFFAVYAPDYTDAEAINRRLAVREKHLAKADANPGMSMHIPICVYGSEYLQTISEVGGAMLSPNECLDKPDAQRKMIGSFMVWECEDYAAAKRMLEEDPYWTGNVVSTTYV